MDFEKMCMLFSMEEPFYGVILSSMEKIPTDKIDTFAVGRSGNVFKMYYNPKFYESLSADCALQIIKHEILHLAFNHFELWEPTVDEQEHKRRNIAEDLEVNCYIDKDKIDPKIGALFPENFGWDRQLGSRAYYDLINTKFPPQNAENKTVTIVICNGGKGGSDPNQQNCDGIHVDENGNVTVVFNTFDDHSKWPSKGSDDLSDAQQVIDELLAMAAEECEKSRGTIPGEMAQKIEQLRKKPKPVADWKRYFRRYMGNEFTEFIRKSKKRESRRFPDAAGNRHRRKSHILVGIDTSGSVSIPELQEFFGQIRTMTAHADFRVIECDSRIQYEYEFRGRPNLNLHGRGGTDFQPVIDVYNNNKRKYDAIVYFTDGEAPIPKDTPKDCLWVISSKGDQKDRNKYRVNGASVVFIPQKK